MLAAIEAFRAHRDPSAAAQVIARLARENELPAVQRAAVRYLGELCVAEAVPTLITTTERGARRGAYDPDIETATLATAALAQIGTEAAIGRLRALAESGTPVALRAAAAQGLERGSRCE